LISWNRELSKDSKRIQSQELQKMFCKCINRFLNLQSETQNMKTSTILITGGAGFIGAHVAKMLDHLEYRTLLFDRYANNSNKFLKHGTFIRGDLGNVKEIEAVCDSFEIQAVMHFAAFIDVGESVVDPAKYYKNNVVNSLNLLEVMRRHAIKYLIFSSSAAIFGVPQQLPISDNHPCNPINPYGETKLIVEKILKSYDAAYGLKSSCLRYFNAAGGDPEGVIKNSKEKESNLIPIILNSLKDGNPITVFGTNYPTPDGSCIRDYIHVEDIGTAHILALEKLLINNRSTNYNLGNGKGFSVWEVIRAIEKVTGKKVNVKEGSRRTGDVPILLADSQKARSELNWNPRYPDLETMIAHAWNKGE
jgi:UDP-glucose 4-epimerase